MAPTRRAVLGTATLALPLAGCLGRSGGGGQPAATVRTRQHDDFGGILVDADGRTLYRFDPDERGAGASACTGGCADAWPPLTVDGEPVAGDGVEAPLTTFDRPDGSNQVAADGWPLYRFASDDGPGEASGQGVNDVWWVVAPDGAKITEAATSSGRSY